MSLQRKLKNALDETSPDPWRAGAVRFPVQRHVQEAFADLHPPLRLIACAGLVLVRIAIGLLIAPSMQDRIVERGKTRSRLSR